MRYIEQLLQELGEGAQLTIFVKDNQFFGVIHEEIGGAHFEVIRPKPFALFDFQALMHTLEYQAEEYLQENS